MSQAGFTARVFTRLHHGVMVPDYERILCQSYAMLLSPGHVVVDIGCHKGFHLEHFLRLVGPTGQALAFEAIPDLVANLRTQFFDHANLAFHNVALSNAPGKAVFNMSTASPGLSGLQPRLVEGQSTEAVFDRKFEVVVDVLDAYTTRLDRLDYIKIDIEGGEIDALEGARKTIARFRPIVSVEYGVPTYSVYGHTAMTLFNYATSVDYLISDLFGNLVRTADEWTEVCDTSYWDYFLVPSEKQQEWEKTFSV